MRIQFTSRRALGVVVFLALGASTEAHAARKIAVLDAKMKQVMAQHVAQKLALEAEIEQREQRGLKYKWNDNYELSARKYTLGPGGKLITAGLGHRHEEYSGNLPYHDLILEGSDTVTRRYHEGGKRLSTRINYARGGGSWHVQTARRDGSTVHYVVHWTPLHFDEATMLSSRVYFVQRRGANGRFEKPSFVKVDRDLDDRTRGHRHASMMDQIDEEVARR